jgi:exopolysaccharide biosynthesis polyprenyl glycosylphosphotransferase
MPRDRTTTTRGTLPPVVSEFTEAIDESVLGVPPEVAQDGPAPHRPVLLNRAATAFAVDVVMVALAVLVLVLVSPTESPSGAIPSEPLGWSLGFSALILAVFFLRGMYALRLRQPVLDELKLVTVSTAIAAATLIAVRVIMQNDPYVAAETVRHAVVAIALVTAGRGGLLWAQSQARRRGIAARPTLIVGAGHVGHMMARRLLDAPELGLRPVGFLDANPLEVRRPADGVEVLGAESDFARVVAEHRVEHVIVTFSTAPHDVLLAVVRDCWDTGVPVSLVPRLFEVEGERVTTRHLGGLPIVGVSPSSRTSWQFFVKAAVDRVGSVVLIVLLAPLLAILALAVRVTMGSPILYRQRRMGRDGRVFTMLKFRTMALGDEEAPEADADWAEEQLDTGTPAGAAAVANRTTPVGQMLRRFSLDELPQLWNVVRGEMSLIGPRPERVGYAEKFGEEVYRYGDRHRVKAGLTGWAQVHGLRGKTSLADRVEWDNHYIENWSLWLDFEISLMTLVTLLRGRGG